ncbi:LEA type 2 family protein [Microbulbifer sp.]|uniref:LEA type 2 family protein n=1 Tax=Microbulbifer sp. TaxID=1908541 RepID=UPI0025900337|nr:LEA type 2 family protein [Microbulbifer sp.]
MPPNNASIRQHHWFSWLRSAIAIIAIGVMSGCAVLSPDFEKPDVQITSVEPLPSTGGDLRFRIHLRVFNPNNTELALSGLYYTLSLAGHKVVTGTSSDLPTITPFGQDAIVVDASASVMGSFMAAAELLKMQGNTVPYELEARLGLRRSLVPYIKVRRDGQIRLDQYR